MPLQQDLDLQFLRKLEDTSSPTGDASPMTESLYAETVTLAAM